MAVSEVTLRRFKIQAQVSHSGKISKGRKPE